VLHGISLTIGEGETVALVGESGSGKSVTARLVLGLLQDLKNATVSGSISFAGEDLSRLTAAERRKLRGTAISMICQDPTSALNPVYTIGKLFREVLRRADPNITAAQAAARALLTHSTLSAADIVKQALTIAGDLCIYTNQNHSIEVLSP